MKYLSVLIIASVFFAGCNKKDKSQEHCITSLKYECKINHFAPDLFTLNIYDKGGYVNKVIASDYVDKILFYGTSDKEKSYYIDGHVESSNDSLKLYFTAGYFRPELGRKQWTSKEVENFLLKDSVGLVHGKDTIFIRNCK